MIGRTVSHYRILEKLGEVPTFPTSLRVDISLSIPHILSLSKDGGSGKWRCGL